jgi:hypothetical protein
MLSTLCFLSVSLVQSGDLAELTNGVSKIAKPGVPGVVSAISPTAVSFVIGQDGKALVPVASAGRFGNGKVVAFGHGGFLESSSIQDGDTGKLVANVIRWCSARTSNLRVGFSEPRDESWIRSLGFSTLPIKRSTLATDLKAVDVAIIPASFDSSTVENYVKTGGGLITAHTPWGWMQLNPGKDLASQMPMQSLLHKAGLSFSDGTAERVWPAKNLNESDRANAAKSLLALESDGQQASTTVLAALRSTTEAVDFNRQVRKTVQGVSEKNPTASTPLTAKDAAARLALAIRQLDREAGKPLPKVEPTAADFPGAVPDNASRIEVSMNLPVDRVQWVSTGLYAAPGEEIRVASSMTLASVHLQIGCHSDTLWHLDRWTRHPQILARTELLPGKTRLTSPFGGLVYIVVNKGHSLPDQKFTFENVVRSARYVHGKTTLADWQNQLKHNAPWAEIGSDRVIFSVPIEDARKVPDPIELMKLWDKSLDLYSELDGRPLPNRAERIVCDRQISAGYMHSGYPIMTWMDKSIEMSLSVKSLTTEGSWGHWHELGHNHQKAEWTFGGTGEVTCNLYSLYLMEKIAGKKLWDRIGGERNKLPDYFAKGGDFNQWKSEPFLALAMYAQLIEAFGWDSMKRYLRSYEGPNAGPLPKTDEEKRDQFMVRYSKVVGKNLAPFFQKWGVPVSTQARASLGALPTWAK